MGQVGGYLLHERAEHATRPVDERVRDYDDIALMPGEQTRREQAGRCMMCGVAFCQSGIAFGGTRHVTGCPLHNRIPEWNDLLWRGLWEQAYERLAMTNPFPEITGRVCPALCEKACNLAPLEGATTIRDNERDIADWALAAGLVRPPRPRDGAAASARGRRVAIVGSGPAGLACAWVLSELGHEVCVYDRARVPGGLLAHGIPTMKLPKDVVARRVSLLEQAGVRFELGVCGEGANETLAGLASAYDAVVVAVGATKARELNVPGADAAGVHLALDYLGGAIEAALGAEGAGAAGAYAGTGNGAEGAGAYEGAGGGASDGRPAIDARGKHVVVIGGGDTGTDCLAMAVRQGAASATQLQYHPAPAVHRSPDNPWPTWPETFTTDYGQAEAAWLDGREDARLWATDTLEVLADETGHARQLRVTQVEWSSGRPVPVPGTERLIPADLVLVARGFAGPESAAFEALGVPLSEGARPRPLMREAAGGAGAGGAWEQASVAGGAGAAHPERWRAQGPENVFVAGDARCGQSLVVNAIADGMDAARAVDAWLAR